MHIQVIMTDPAIPDVIIPTGINWTVDYCGAVTIYGWSPINPQEWVSLDSFGPGTWSRVTPVFTPAN